MDDAMPVWNVHQLRRMCMPMALRAPWNRCQVFVSGIDYYLIRCSAHECLAGGIVSGPNGGVMLFGAEFLPY